VILSPDEAREGFSTTLDLPLSKPCPDCRGESSARFFSADVVAARAPSPSTTGSGSLFPRTYGTKAGPTSPFGPRPGTGFSSASISGFTLSDTRRPGRSTPTTGPANRSEIPILRKLAFRKFAFNGRHPPGSPAATGRRNTVKSRRTLPLQFAFHLLNFPSNPWINFRG
jgi:hypothetical protein